MEDYYKILGVQSNSNPDDIKKAYRKLSLKHHPDRGGDASEFKKINEAYQTLGSPEKRKMYDMQQNNPRNEKCMTCNKIILFLVQWEKVCLVILKISLI